MKGSIIIERINNPELRDEWHNRLDKLNIEIKKLYKIRQTLGAESTEVDYLEAVLRFAEARDNERTFFWDTFMEERVQNPQPE